MSHTNKRQPDRLKMQWDRATRLASRDWPIAASSAVMVVPRLSPRRMGMAPVEADDARSIGARRGSEVLQHGDGGAGALHHERHEGAHQNAEHRHARHLGNQVGEHGVLGQRLHDSAHGVDAEEQKPEAEDGGATYFICPCLASCMIRKPTSTMPST